MQVCEDALRAILPKMIPKGEKVRKNDVKAENGNGNGPDTDIYLDRHAMSKKSADNIVIADPHCIL